jgi:NTE family protein
MMDRKILLLKSHQCSDGLTDDELREIAEHLELVEYQTGEYAYQINDEIKDVNFVVQGRFRLTASDRHGNPILEKFLTRGDQFGSVAAAYGEPIPVVAVAEEPSTTLKLDYKVALELTKRIDTLRMNLSRSIANDYHAMLFGKKPRQRSAVIAVFHDTKTGSSLTPRLVKRLRELGETPSVLSSRSDWEQLEGVKFRSLIEDGQRLTPDEVRRQVNQWSDTKRVFVDVDASVDPEAAALLVEMCEEVLWCVTPSDWELAVDRLNAIESRAPGWREKIHVVWMLDKDDLCAPQAPALRALTKKHFQFSLHQPQPRQGNLLTNGFERIIHHLRGISVGVALGGGAARGMAHLGVLKALEQNGIVVDMIAGTSAGAMTGVFYAADLDVDYSVESFVKDLKPPWFFRQLPAGNYWYLVYKYRRGHFDKMLRKYLSDRTLTQLPLPVHTVTVDLVRGEAVVRSDGDAVHAITESINLPVLSKPICRDGRTLVDGGLVNNIPADVLVSKGCNFVIAVSVTAKIEHEFAKNHPDTPTGSMKSPWTIQTVLRSYVVQSSNMHSVGVQPADVIIKPDMTGFDVAEFTRTDEMAVVGEKTTLQEISNIKQQLSEMDDKLFPDK